MKGDSRKEPPKVLPVQPATPPRKPLWHRPTMTRMPMGMTLNSVGYDSDGGGAYTH